MHGPCRRPKARAGGRLRVWATPPFRLGAGRPSHYDLGLGAQPRARLSGTALTLASQSFDPAQTRALFWSVFPSVMLPMFLAVSDQTIVASALPAIAGSLGDVERVSWVVISYLLAATVAAPLFGYLGDMFGRRTLMFVALAAFCGASVLCALAPSLIWLVIARVLQGLGGGGLMATSQALIGEVVPARQRGHYQGYLATVATVSSVFGPVGGGFLTEHFGWRSIFYVNLPLGALAAVLTLRLAIRPGVRREGWSFDWEGLFFFVAFVVPLLLALEQARRLNASTAALAAALLAVAAAAFVMLLRREKQAPSPLLPLSLFAQPAIWRANGLAMCHGSALISLVTFLPIYLRVVHGLSPGRTGLMLLPLSIGIGVGSIVTGRLVSRTGMTMPFPSYGLLVSTAGLLLFALASPWLSLPQMVALLSVIALSMGSVMAVVQVTVQTKAGRGMLGAAAGSVQFSRTVGAALGAALTAAVLFAALSWTDAGVALAFERLLDEAQSGRVDVSGAAASAPAIKRAFQLAFLLLPLFTAAGSALAFANPARRV